MKQRLLHAAVAATLYLSSPVMALSDSGLVPPPQHPNARQSDAREANEISGDLPFAMEDMSQPPPPKTIKPGTLFKDTRLVAYDYDANRTYPVKARALIYTEIVPLDGERITAYYPSADEKRGWPFVVSGDKKRLFVMPLEGGIANTATLVTNKRTYLLAFESNTRGEWYQRVRWLAPLELAFDGASPTKAFEAEPTQVDGSPASSEPPMSADVPRADKVNFDYRFKGEATFKPLMVFDDGKTTWIKMPPQNGVLPALFALDHEKRPELANYVVDGDTIKSAQVSRHGWLMKLGDEEIRILPGGTDRSVFNGWFD